jgi:hypothetical protein
LQEIGGNAVQGLLVRGRLRQQVDAVAQHGRAACLQRAPDPHAGGGVLRGQREDQ